MKGKVYREQERYYWARIRIRGIFSARRTTALTTELRKTPAFRYTSLSSLNHLFCQDVYFPINRLYLESNINTHRIIQYVTCNAVTARDSSHYLGYVLQIVPAQRLK